MPQPYGTPPGSSTGRDATPTPPELPDLFGNLPPSPAPPRRSKPSGRPAEWPAAPASPTEPSTPTPSSADRTPRRHLGTGADALAGTYDRAGSTLRRADGLALVLCLSSSPQTGRGSSHYVRVASPSSPGRPRYAGNLYPARTPGACDLDGCQFQDRQTRTRYRIALDAAGDAPARYTVAPVTRSRKRASA